MISHEFRTPLATALIFISLLLQQVKDAKSTEYLNLIKNSLNLLMSLVNNLVDLKLIKENCFRPQAQTFSPLEALKFVRSLLLP